MGNNIKRFLTNKNTVTILAVLAGVVVLFIGYTSRINKAINPTRVPIANKEIGAAEKITEDDFEFVEVNSDFLKDVDIITNYGMLTGNYVAAGTSIPKGGLFYKSQVVPKNELPNAVFDDIPEGYTGFTLKVDNDSTYGNSIYPGDRIDLYIKANSDLGKIMFGKFVESIEVLKVRDSNQDDVYADTDVKEPALLLFAVEDDMFDLLTLASFISGLEIIPVPRNKAYTTDAGSTEVKSETLKAYILSNGQIVED